MGRKRSGRIEKFMPRTKGSVNKLKEIKTEVETPQNVEMKPLQDIEAENKFSVGTTYENAKITEILWETENEVSVRLDNGTTTVIDKRS